LRGFERTAAVDQTQAVREVRRALQAESDELRGHREWLASIRANAAATLTLPLSPPQPAAARSRRGGWFRAATNA